MLSDFLTIVKLVVNVALHNSVNLLVYLNIWNVNLSAYMGMIKDRNEKEMKSNRNEKEMKSNRNEKDLTEAEEIMKRWQEHREELYKKDLNDLDNHYGVFTHLEPDIL